MIKKLLVVLMLAVPLAGCNTFSKKPIIKTEYVEKLVPVNAVPQPPKVERPIPETSLLTDADRKDIGKVAKAVTVEKKQWEDYSTILETIINKYKELADKAEVQSQLEIILPLPTPLVAPPVSDSSSPRP